MLKKINTYILLVASLSLHHGLFGMEEEQGVEPGRVIEILACPIFENLNISDAVELSRVNKKLCSAFENELLWDHYLIEIGLRKDKKSPSKDIYRKWYNKSYEVRLSAYLHEPSLRAVCSEFKDCWRISIKSSNGFSKEEVPLAVCERIPLNEALTFKNKDLPLTFVCSIDSGHITKISDYVISEKITEKTATNLEAVKIFISNFSKEQPIIKLQFRNIENKK